MRQVPWESEPIKAILCMCPVQKGKSADSAPWERESKTAIGCNQHVQKDRRQSGATGMSKRIDGNRGQPACPKEKRAKFTVIKNLALF
ncbi:hypothetical protein B5B98_07725 [Staphylococcus delphini]|nr:hypothetical protein B5B98_07725 [Staphylococcus delphini]